ERVGRLQRRHRDLEPVLPVPPSHGWAQDAGLVVLRAMDGSTLKACLDRPDQAVPDPRDLGALLDRIPAIDDGGRTRSLLRTAGGHVELLRRLAPAAAPEIERMAEAFDRGAGLPA